MPRSNKQTILSYYDGFTPILALLAFFWLFYLKSNDNAAYMWFIILPLALNLVQKKFCVLQKKVLSFGPNRTVEVRPNRTFGRSLLYRTFLKGPQIKALKWVKKILKIVFDWKLQFGFWVNPASQNCLLHHMNLWVFKRGPIHIYQKGIFLGNGSSKVHIFWEGHKILWNLHLTFVLCSASVRCCKILWPSQNIWTLIVVAKHSSP